MRNERDQRPGGETLRTGTAQGGDEENRAGTDRPCSSAPTESNKGEFPERSLHFAGSVRFTQEAVARHVEQPAHAPRHTKAVLKGEGRT